MVYLLIGIFLVIIFISLFILIHPTFGENPSKRDKERYSKFENFKNGKFVNNNQISMNMSFRTILSFWRDSITGNKDRKPRHFLPLLELESEKILSKEDSLTWFGHSTFLISIEGKKMLLDPVFGSIVSPVPFAGSKRYSGNLLYLIDNLPYIDAVFITHDHYDHLDYSSILKLEKKTGSFFVPHGVGKHLQKWGVKKESIYEFNWWDEVNWSGLRIASVPSQHFSGRGLFNRNSTLWSGWVIIGNQKKVFVSGDGGYGSHFKKIGKKYGPFDISLIEGAQYDKRWADVHMVPEQSIQAHLDVKGRYMMLSHWGAFTLAFHGWTEPIERAIQDAKEKDVSLIIPKLGETLSFKNEFDVPKSFWWKEYFY